VSTVSRTATAADAATIMQLVRELAAFEGLADQVRMTTEDVLRDGFGERACFECLLAEIGGEAIGMALYFTTYSTFEGRANLYVEDLRRRWLGWAASSKSTSSPTSPR
jgi:hypothetical protein